MISLLLARKNWHDNTFKFLTDIYIKDENANSNITFGEDIFINSFRDYLSASLKNGHNFMFIQKMIDIDIYNQENCNISVEQYCFIPRRFANQVNTYFDNWFSKWSYLKN